MKTENLKSYDLIRHESIGDLNSEGYLLKHTKTGAKVVVLENSDDNKVFGIAFRTPPSDSTGVPHIMEHSVLCGSKKFPAKDPFVELAKGSLNTFLNAMTFPDKTVYPVASCNDTDFKNLMDVYLDAVFYPNIYSRPQIFKQEGWHYEIENKEEPITVNGVVYNEMRGVFSSADDILERKVMEILFPDNAYFYESGGDPQIIPDLTYEDFIDFHKKYYHPSNCYIYLYGNADMEERLSYIDSEYLSKFDAIDIDSAIVKQKPFDKPVTKYVSYSITADESLEDKTHLSYTSVIGDSLDPTLYVAFQIIEYALLLAPGAVLNQALLDTGIAGDIQGSYECSTLQPYFSIIAKNSNKDSLDTFLETIQSVLAKVVKEGFDKQALRAAINFYEFRYREADYSYYPKGLMYCLQSFDSWLYDENEPFMHIKQNDTYAFLKSQVDTDYFEKLIEKYLLGNPHTAIIIVEPKQGLTAELDAKLADKLAKYKETLSDKEIEKLIEDTKALHKYQEEPSTQEELDSIPMLSRSDMTREAKPFVYKENLVGDVKYITEDVFTNGIGYLNLVFKITGFPLELIPYLSLAKGILGLVDTEKYKYADLFNLININSGGITFAMPGYNNVSSDSYDLYFEVRGKALLDKIPFLFEMTEEVLFHSDFSDKKRIKDLITMSKTRMQESMPASGHVTSAFRALSYCSVSGLISEMISGIDYYRFIDELESDFDNRYEELISKIKQALNMAFCRDNLIVSFTSEEKYKDICNSEIEKFAKILPKMTWENKPFAVTPVRKNEGFKTSSKVQYVAMAGNYSQKGLKYTGALRLLKVMLSYDYLWNNIRVKGGAYGCMNTFKKSGGSFFVSYRDPNLDKTIEVYKNAAEYVRNFEAGDKELTKYIIGTFSDIDTPLTPSATGSRSFVAYLIGDTNENEQRERDEILDITPDIFKSLADYIDAIIEQDLICVVGGEEIVEANKDLFDSISNLI